MRLYLSSFRFGDRMDELVRLVGPGRRAAIVMNALDNFPDQRKTWLDGQVQILEARGFSVSELDLRDYFGRSAALSDRLNEIDLVWANGGNTFVLRRAMKQSGFDHLIAEALRRDTIVYAGFSAGTVICAPSLRGLETIDKPDNVPPGYDPDVIWDGLGLLPFSVVVHYRSDHDEASLAEEEARFYQANAIPYRTLRDGEALVVEGERQEIVGGRPISKA